DCQLSPAEDDMPPARDTGQPRGGGDAPRSAADGGDGELCYCRHRIFGRGKIVRQLPPDKVQVHFPGFGLKVILREYLLLEN
ncbi:MAG: ATP-dependent helicase, partial [Desulfovibrio sp.]|nr:ATP-dependent helicase [Desulfovibrio sp.]